MQVLRSNEYRRMPWKNGAGETIEIAVSPASAGLDDFEWRISMAAVPSSGAFSIFAGVDRTLSILEGDGLQLEIDGAPTAVLTTASAPFAFPADVPVHAQLLGRPVADLNVMTRRRTPAHVVRRLPVHATERLTTKADVCAVLCRSKLLQVDAFRANSCTLVLRSYLQSHGERLVGRRSVVERKVRRLLRDE